MTSNPYGFDETLDNAEYCMEYSEDLHYKVKVEKQTGGQKQEEKPKINPQTSDAVEQEYERDMPMIHALLEELKQDPCVKEGEELVKRKKEQIERRRKVALVKIGTLTAELEQDYQNIESLSAHKNAIEKKIDETSKRIRMNEQKLEVQKKRANPRPSCVCQSMGTCNSCAAYYYMQSYLN